MRSFHCDGCLLATSIHAAGLGCGKLWSFGHGPDVPETAHLSGPSIVQRWFKDVQRCKQLHRPLFRKKHRASTTLRESSEAACAHGQLDKSVLLVAIHLP